MLLQHLGQIVCSQQLVSSGTVLSVAQSIDPGLVACSNSKAQLLRAAEYYFNHLDGKVPVVLLSDDVTLPASNLNGGNTQHAQHEPGKLPEQQSDQLGVQTDEDVLDSMLEQQFPGMFDLSALRAAVPTERDAPQVRTICAA